MFILLPLFTALPPIYMGTSIGFFFNSASVFLSAAFSGSPVHTAIQARLQEAGKRNIQNSCTII
jgi:hypothetical protein